MCRGVGLAVVIVVSVSFIAISLGVHCPLSMKSIRGDGSRCRGCSYCGNHDVYPVSDLVDDMAGVAVEPCRS